MKRLICALLAAALIFTGCSTLKENNKTSDLPDLVQRKTSDASTTEVIRPSLYFYDANADKLVAEVREIEIGFDEDKETIVLKTLLKGPLTEGLSGISKGASIEGVEIFDGCANVYVKSSVSMADADKFKMAVAISDTLIDFSSVTYVSVFINGSVLTVGGNPCGPLKKSDGNVTTMYKEYYAKYVAAYETQPDAERQIDAVLYFPDITGTYLRAEVRRIKVEGGDYISALMQELSNGPTYSYYMKPYISKDAISAATLTAIYNAETAQYSLIYPDNIFTTSGNKALEVSGLYYTIAGTMPNVYRLLFESGSLTRIATHNVASTFLGNEITLSFPDSNGSSLKAVSRTVQVSESGKMSTYIAELMRGPVNADEEYEIGPAFPDGIKITDLLGVSRTGSTAVVNLSQNFYNEASQMSDWDQKLMVFSIVNTLTNISGIKSVRFLIEGKSARDLGGSINIESPLLPNTGLQG